MPPILCDFDQGPYSKHTHARTHTCTLSEPQFSQRITIVISQSQQRNSRCLPGARHRARVLRTLSLSILKTNPQHQPPSGPQAGGAACIGRQRAVEGATLRVGVGTELQGWGLERCGAQNLGCQAVLSRNYPPPCALLQTSVFLFFQPEMLWDVAESCLLSPFFSCRDGRTKNLPFLD